MECKKASEKLFKRIDCTIVDADLKPLHKKINYGTSGKS